MKHVTHDGSNDVISVKFNHCTTDDRVAAGWILLNPNRVFTRRKGCVLRSVKGPRLIVKIFNWNYIDLMETDLGS